MNIDKIIINNYKALKKVELALNAERSIIVGDNEKGKSTLLEAINLVLSGQVNGRNVSYDISPFMFNNDAVTTYIESLQKGEYIQPPTILVEHLSLFRNNPSFVHLS